MSTLKLLIDPLATGDQGRWSGEQSGGDSIVQERKENRSGHSEKQEDFGSNLKVKPARFENGWV